MSKKELREIKYSLPLSYDLLKEIKANLIPQNHLFHTSLIMWIECRLYNFIILNY